MRFFTIRSTLSKKEKLDAKEYERPANIKFLLTLLLVPLMLLAFSFNYEVKLNNILAKNSQIDETDSLTTIDRIKMNRIARDLREKTGIDLEFYITRYGIQTFTPREQSLFISINVLQNEAELLLPFENPSIQARLESSLKTCINYNELGYCITDTVTDLYDILTTAPLPTQTDTKLEYKGEFIREN